jgi:geranylgeranyl diphosphate synthase type I
MKTTLCEIETALKALFRDIDRRYRLKHTSPILFKALREFVLRPGKRVRPFLFMLAYTGFTPRRTFSRHRLARAAASIELLHDFMLIHDDVIDASDLRRGKPTLHRVFNRHVRPEDGARLGTELAIVAGDILYAVAIETLLEIDEAPARKVAALKELAAAAASTGVGEFIDVVSGHRAIDRIREKEILFTYTQKTARYTFSAPLVMGALLAGASGAQTKKLHDLGIDRQARPDGSCRIEKDASRLSRLPTLARSRAPTSQNTPRKTKKDVGGPKRI